MSPLGLPYKNEKNKIKIKKRNLVQKIKSKLYSFILVYYVNFTFCKKKKKEKEVYY